MIIKVKTLVFCGNFMSMGHSRNVFSGFLTRFDTNQAVLAQKMVRDLKFPI